MTKKFKLLLICQLSFVLLLAWHNSATALSPKAILQQCDQARGNISGVTWNLEVEANEGKKISHRHLLVRSRSYNIIAETLSPARRRGQMLILLNGNMWFYKPGLSKPIPVSKRQKLLGLANNGDIASTNYAENYTVLHQEQEPLDGEPCFVFSLQAKTSKATYKLIKYWVSRQRLVGIKAEFYTARGSKLLKSTRIEYKNHIASPKGKLQPFISQMVIHDELMSANTTVLNFSSPSLKPIPASAFNLNLLKK
jgi:outer membrane lipoprotein-sorting protein